MKYVVKPLKFICMVIVCSGVISSCHKVETVEPSVNTGSSSPAADSLSDHLQFINAKKIQGAIPAGTQASSLKISFEDTLYLMDQVKMPVKFLHEDITQNVAGIYMQVMAAAIGGTFNNASYYYDVPEVAEMDSSDTVSVIMIGFDRTNLQVPVSFNITITPYNSSGQPIAQAIRPVKIAEHKTDPNGNAGSCGLVLPDDDYWNWELSYILANPITQENPFYFYNDPYKVFGTGGQIIRGNCCNGISVYGFCSPLDTTLKASLHFATYYRIMSETLTFHEDGTFFRQTFEDGADPLPAASDFCAGGEGVISYNLRHTTYNGNYTVTPVTLPPDLQGYDDSLTLSLQTTSSSPQGGGYGNGGGIIHQADCNIGSLVLIQVDREGFGQHMYKFYSRRSYNQSSLWYPF